MKPRQSKTFLAGSLAVILVGATAIVAVAGYQSVPSGAVAKVGDRTITQKEFDHWMTVAATSQQQQQEQQQAQQGGKKDSKKKSEPVQVPQPGDPTYDALRDQVMQFLINGAWIQNEAEDRGVELTDSQVEKQFEQTKEQSFPSDKQYKRFLKQSGMTQEDVNFRVRLDLLSQRIREEVTGGDGDVSKKDVKRYYQVNEERFTQPERRDLRVVVNEKKSEVEKAKAALERDDSAKNWKKVAKKYSTDEASKGEGGKLPGVTKGQQDAALDEAAFAAKKGEIGGPVKTDLGWYVFQVTKVTPQSKQSLSESEESIRSILVAQNQQEALDSFVQSFRAKWKKNTKCKSGFIVADCGNAPDTVQVQPGAPPVQSTKPIAPGQNTQRQGLPQSPLQAPSAAPEGQVPGGLPGGVPQGVPPQGAPPQGAPPQGAPPQGGPPPEQGGPPPEGVPQQGAPPPGAE